MKSLRTVRYSLLAAAVAGGAMFSTAASAEVSATAGVANLYLWRGQNLGNGSPVVQGSLDYSHDSGLFAGVWGSSAGPDQEVDLYAGYAYSSDDFGLKATVYDYSYPRTTNPNAQGDLQELIVGVTAGSFFADAVLGIADYDDNYVDVGYTVGKFTGKIGFMLADGDDSTPTTAATPANLDEDYIHADLTYAYNERLAFTVSGILDDQDDSIFAGANTDPLFVVSYTLPLELK